MEELTDKDIKWLNFVRETGQLIAIYDKRVGEETHLKADRIEVYYKEVGYETLKVFINIEKNEIVGFETY